MSNQMQGPGGAKPNGSGRSRRWRPHWGRVLTELVVVFVGVTAAFFVEGYREQLDQDRELRQASAAILEELRVSEVKGQAYVDSMRAALGAWHEADEAGRRAVPRFFLIPGAPAPPTSAWESAVASGVASGFDPEFRYRLGYFYNEFAGIQVNYLRHVDFIEKEVMPRALLGPDAFYDASGRFDPAVRVRIGLMGDYVDDFQRLVTMAAGLADELEAMQEKQ